MTRRIAVALALLLALLPLGLAPAGASASDLEAMAARGGDAVLDLTPVARVAQAGRRQPGSWVTFRDEAAGGVRQVSDYLVDARPAADGSVGITVRTTLMCLSPTGSAWFTTTKTVYADGAQAAYIGPDYRVATYGSPVSQQASFRVSGGGPHHVTSREDPFRPDAVVSAGWDFRVDVPYVIRAAAGPGGSISPAGASFADAGSSRTYTVRADAGHRVRDVAVDGSSVGARGSHTFSDIQADHSISAEFVATHRVTFKDRGAVLSEQTVDDGSAARAPSAPARKGYTFTGWDVDFSNVKSDIEVDATWRPNSYRVRFDANGGAGSMPDQAMAYDRAARLSANRFSRTGYTWAGWTAAPDGSGASYGDGQEVANLTAEDGGTVTLYARWRPNAYRVRFDANGGAGEMADQAMTYDRAEGLRANGFSRVGYTWAGWSTGADGSGASFSDGQEVSNLAAGDGAVVTLYAKWRPNRYRVAFDKRAPAARGSMPDQQMAYDAPEALDPCAFTWEGHVFRGWSSDAGAYGDRQVVENLSAEDGAVVTLRAEWDVATHPVTFTDGLGGGISSESVPHGTSATEPERPSRPGYSFDGWDAGFSKVTGPLTVNATWRPNRYTIGFDANGGSGVMPDQAMAYDEADELESCAFSRPGHRFQGWALEPGGAVAYSDQQEVENLTAEDGGEIELFAVWDEDADVRISYAAADPAHSGVSRGHEDVAPSSGEARGSTATAAEGYRLAGWFDAASGDPVGGGAHFAPERGGDGLWRPASYEARVEPIGYTVRFHANGGAGEMDDQRMTYDRAEALSACAFKRPGYLFGGWSTTAGGDIAYMDKERVTNLTMENDDVVNLHAVWIENPAVTISYRAEDPAHSSVTVTTEQLAPATGTAAGSRAIVSDGYQLVGWSDWAGDTVGTEETFTPTRVPGHLWKSREYTMDVAPIAYTVRFDANKGDGAMDNQHMTYDQPSALNTCTFTKPGYRFLGWNTVPDGSGTSFTDEQEVVNLASKQGDTVTLYAQWAKKLLNVTFNDGQGNTFATSQVPYGDKATPPDVPAREGYDFAGWDANFGCVTTDLNISATWKRTEDTATPSDAGNEHDVAISTAQPSASDDASETTALDQTGGNSLVIGILSLTGTLLSARALMGRQRHKQPHSPGEHSTAAGKTDTTL